MDGVQHEREQLYRAMGTQSGKLEVVNVHTRALELKSQEHEKDKVELKQTLHQLAATEEARGTKRMGVVHRKWKNSRT